MSNNHLVPNNTRFSRRSDYIVHQNCRGHDSRRIYNKNYDRNRTSTPKSEVSNAKVIPKDDLKIPIRQVPL
ncbi:13779_t:CDS:2 [Dentiscutata heterogama]|uniref:13779_t:CDS:1 n=1 Tax=Dentiscutata heterogama TaxID=1316150 RepID=A0ACA9KSM1_9GLOM|nr:13779_t:CDS:2 [Dentiscutata heterogama]